MKTNYYFCVAPLDHDDDDEDELQDAKTATTVSSALSGGLDRFAQFFVSPLFKDDAIERELRAVDSEYSNSLNSDQWRMHQLLKSSCDPRHPFSKYVNFLFLCALFLKQYFLHQLFFFDFSIIIFSDSDVGTTTLSLTGAIFMKQLT